MTYTTLVVLSGISLLGVCSGLVGCFAVLRRRALIGDALAHAALPGVCLGFLVLGERNLPVMLLGGLATGVLGIVIVSALRHLTRIKEDAAIGIVLSVFYGAGVVLIGWIQHHTAAGSRAGLDSYFLGKTAGMLRSDVLLIGGVSLFCLLLIVLMYKEFKVVAFDPGFAGVQGWPAFRLDLLLMTMIAVTVIVGLPAVGVVLMAALLIIPAAAARFWTDRLGVMLALSAAFGLLIGATGALVTTRYALPSGPMIVLAGAVLFFLSLLLAPRRGVLARALSARSLRQRLARQRLLRRLYERTEDASPARPTISWDDLSRHPSSGRAGWELPLARLVSAGLITQTPDGVTLTSAGRQEAAAVVRTHRLWQLYLTEYPEQAGSVVDLETGSVDDRLPRELVAQLESQLAHQRRNPIVAYHPT